MTFIYIICIIVIIGWIFYLRQCHYTNYDNYLKEFIECSNNITVITSDTDIIAMNKAGLDFFHFSTFKAFQKKHKYLSKLFREIQSEDKYVEGINWVTKIDKTQHIEVEMLSNDFRQIFSMQVSKVRDNRYVVSFYNISRLIAEKNAIVKVAEKDELTQVYNRSKFNKVLSQAFRQAEIYQEPFTLILFDIDHFKMINDQYGHNIGDNVLLQLASLIQGQLRAQDTFARWGGEEFIILSQGSSEKESYTQAERLRQSIESFPFDDVSRITCSFGVSQYRFDESTTSLLKRVDDALYQAKNSGRNRVCIEDSEDNSDL